VRYTYKCIDYKDEYEYIAYSYEYKYEYEYQVLHLWVRVSEWCWSATVVPNTDTDRVEDDASVALRRESLTLTALKRVWPKNQPCPEKPGLIGL